jgi:CBS domain-containing protein
LFSLVLAAIRSEHYDDLKKTIKKVLELSIKDFMKKDVVTIDVNEDIYTAAKIMNKNDIDRLPVTEDEKLVGIVTRWDFIRALEKIK